MEFVPGAVLCARDKSKPQEQLLAPKGGMCIPYLGHFVKCGLVCRTGYVVVFSQRGKKRQTGAREDGSVSKLRGGPRFESPNPHKIA